MGYAFEVGETVAAGVHRIVDEQVGKAVQNLEGADAAGLEAAVHDFRKRTKKLRGLVRLVRPSLRSAHRAANVSFRDAARALSPLRDAHAMLATFDDLVAASPDLLPDGGLLGARAGLARHAAMASRAPRREAIATAVDLMRAGRRHVAGAGLDGGWSVVEPGLKRSYRDGRRALGEVRDDARAEAVHEWRKRVKDTWYHVRLLQGAAPAVLRPLGRRFHDLSDALGDAHDLVVIAGHLRSDPDGHGGPAQVAAAGEIAATRRLELERRAVSLGRRLYAEKPKAHARRMGAYWEVWHGSGDEAAAGALADVFPAGDGLDDLGDEALRDRAGEAALAGHLQPARDDLIGELRARGADVRGAGVRGAGVRGAGVRGAGVRGAGVRGAGVRGAGVRGGREP